MDINNGELKDVTILEEETDEEKQSEKPQGNKVLRCLRTNLLTILTVGGVVAGAVLGIILRAAREEGWSDREIMYVEFLGDIFLRMLKCLILPLIVSSLVSAIASLDLSLSGKIAARTVAFYLTTTFCAVVLGIIMVVAIQPGANKDDVESGTATVRNVTTVDTLLDLIR